MVRRGASHTANRGKGGSGRGDKKSAGGGGGGRPPPSREVTVSRNLSYLLRHNAEDEGVRLDEGGWANVADVLLWRKLASMQVTLAELKLIVETNDKQRYQLKPNPNIAPHEDNLSTDPSHYLIRASQGHSITTISTEQLLTPVLAADADCPDLVVHGTYTKYWDSIRKSGGLKPMKRNHIHFATREPKILKPIEEETEVCKTRDVTHDKDKLLSGMRQSASVMIWVDVKKSLEGGVKWWRSQNNVFLTEGLEKAVSAEGTGGGKREKILGFEWFRWVEKRNVREGKMEVLWKAEGVEPDVGDLQPTVVCSYHFMNLEKCRWRITPREILSYEHLLIKDCYQKEKAEHEMRIMSLGKESQVGKERVADVGGKKVDGGSVSLVVNAVEPSAPVKENWDD